jgi:hypothetical protein
MCILRTHNFSGHSTDCIGSCKSNYHMITAMTVPLQYLWASDCCLMPNEQFFSENKLHFVEMMMFSALY